MAETAADSVYCSIFCYALGKEAAERGMPAQRLVTIEAESGFSARWPAFRTLAHLRTIVDQVELTADAATLIAKARSTAAAHFLTTPGPDVWISVDDDVEADAEQLELLISAAREHDLVFAPQLQRDGALNVRFDGDVLPFADELARVSTSKASTRIAPIASAGCSLMAMHRHALEAMHEGYPELWCDAKPPFQPLPLFGVFLEQVAGGYWIGEDWSFCQRARRVGIVPKLAIDSETSHMNRRLPRTWFDDLARNAAHSKDG